MQFGRPSKYFDPWSEKEGERRIAEFHSFLFWGEFCTCKVKDGQSKQLFKWDTMDLIMYIKKLKEHLSFFQQI